MGITQKVVPIFYLNFRRYIISIEHKNITDPNIHEPKGVAAATTKQVYVANGAGSGVWKRVQESDLDFSDKSKNLFGWNDIADSQYTSGSPLAVGASTRTNLPNNGLAAQSDTSRLGAIWDSVQNRFVINDLNASFILRCNLRVKAAAAAGTPYVVKLELESSNGPTVIAATDQVIKGGNYENAVSFTSFFYLGSFINNQPLKLYITADTAITVYNIGFTIQRNYKES